MKISLAYLPAGTSVTLYTYFVGRRFEEEDLEDQASCGSKKIASKDYD